MTYAQNTKVPIDRSQGEIRKLLTKYGATGFAFAENTSMAHVIFEIKGLRIKFILHLPKTYSENATQASIKACEQLCRAKWRSLVLCIKAKLECVESGITTLEDEFLAHIVLSSGQTMGDFSIPQIQQSYKENKMPPLLGYAK